MTENFTINSQYYVSKDNKEKRIERFIKITFAIYVLVILFQMLMEGFSWYRVLVILLSYVILKNFINRLDFGYQFSVLNLAIDKESLNLIYSGVKYRDEVVDINVKINTNSISHIEFSEKQNAIRVVGNVSEKIVGNQNETSHNDWVIYVKDNAEDIRKAIEEKTGQNIVYVDSQ
jgi:hypothetical protein